MLKFYPREFLPDRWASIQHNLAAASFGLGSRIEGPEASRLLNDAVTGYREALRVRTRELYPVEWATTESALGSVLLTQAMQIEGGQAIVLVREAVAAYKEALLV